MSRRYLLVDGPVEQRSGNRVCALIAVTKSSPGRSGVVLRVDGPGRAS